MKSTFHQGSASAKRIRLSSAAIILVHALALSAFSEAQAAVKTWSGAGADGNWQTANNWVGGAVPAPPNESLVFTGSIRTNNTNNWSSGKIFPGITFDANAALFTLHSVSGGTVTITAGGITNNSPNLQTLYCPLRINGGTGVVDAASGSLSIGGAIGTANGIGWLRIQGTNNVRLTGSISVTGGIVQQGGGTLTLSGSNSYNGDTILSGGTLRLGASEVIPDGNTAGNVVFSPSSLCATLDLCGQTESINGLSSTGAGSSIVDNASGTGVLVVGANGASSSFSGEVRNTAGTVALTKVGTGTLTLSGPSTYSGPTTVAAGALVLGTAWCGAGPMSVSDGATLGVQPATQDATLRINSLALGSSSSGRVTNNFILGALGNPVSAVESVANNLTLNGTVVVNLVGTALTAGNPIPLVRYGQLVGSGSFVVGSVPPGFSGTLATNASTRTIELTLSLGGPVVTPTALPNVLLVVADQWRGCGLSFGPYHDAEVRTPHLERLASQGIRFDRCYATYPLCTPNRATLITGRYPTQTGMMGNDLMLPPDVPCIADVFTDASYVTYYCGKYHIDGSAIPGYVPKLPKNWRRRGYQIFEGFNRGHHYFSTSVIFDDNGQVISVPTNNPNGASFDQRYLVDYEPHRETDLAMSFIRANTHRPWFVHLNWGPPHSPYTPPPVFDTYDAAGLTARPNNLAQQSMSSLAGSYGSREALDYEFGRLVQTIDDLGLASRTLILFTSDHGDLLGSHGLSAKNKPEDESLRVPLLMRWPGKIPAGQASDFLIATVDLMPTILRLVGLEVPAIVAGKDKSSVILGTNLVETPVFGESSLGWRSVVKRTGGKVYKLVMEVSSTYQPTKLWNLDDDPYEMNNLVDQPACASLQRELQQEILGWQQAVGDPWPAQTPALASTIYPDTPGTVLPVTISLQSQADGTWLARVPSQSRVWFNLQQAAALMPTGWTNVGPTRSGNGNVLSFPLPCGPEPSAGYFRILQTW